jgi:hypothetical protein
MTIDDNLPSAVLGEISSPVYEPYEIQADLIFISRPLPLGPRRAGTKKRRPILPRRPLAIRVDNGNFGIITNARPQSDHDDLEEVYLEGELVMKDEFDLEETLLINQLRITPGSINLTIRQDIAGLVLDKNDYAQVKIIMGLTLVNPKKLVSKCPQPEAPKANERINAEIMALIKARVTEYLLGNAGLWSNPNFNDVMSEFVKKINFSLDPYGLQIKDDFVTFKSYPAVLRDLIIEFQIMERYFLGQVNQKRLNLTKLGLSVDDISTINIVSKHYGVGAGLFELSMKDNSTAKIITEWLDTLSSRPDEIIQFLQRRYSGKSITLEKLEFTRQVVLAAFRSPILAVGEWADSATEAL